MRILAVLLLLGFANHLVADELLRYDGKELKAKDLPVTIQQRIAELESEHYHKMKLLLQDAAIELYVQEQAKKQKKSADEVRKALIVAKEPSDADAKKFYEENKAQIPYPYDAIKSEIKKIMQGQRKEEAKVGLIARIEREKKVRVLMDEPQFPKIELNVAEFYQKGSKDAKVKIVEFADYQCPHCKHAAESFKKILEKDAKDVSFTFVDFPIHPSGISRTIAEGAYCANKQGKFWEYHYLAFDKQRELVVESPKEFAKSLKLDQGKFDACLTSKEAKDFVEKGRKEGERVGVSGTPGIYINGRKAQISHDIESLKEAISKAKAGSA